MTTINLDTDSLTLTISDAGEANTNSNAGSGAELVKTKSGVDTPIRSITGGANITVTENTNDVNIAVTNDYNNVDNVLQPNADDSLPIGSLSRQWTDLYLTNYRIQNANSRIEIDADTEVLIETTDQAYEIDTGAADLTLRTDTSNNVRVPSNLIVQGNLTVNGDTTTLDTTNLLVEDRIIELAHNATAGADSGIVIERGTSGDNAAIFWDESEDRFHIATTTSDGDETGNFSGVADADLKMATANIGTLNANGTNQHEIVMSSTGDFDNILAIKKYRDNLADVLGNDAGFTLMYDSGDLGELNVGGFLGYAPSTDDRRMYVMVADPDNSGNITAHQMWKIDDVGYKTSQLRGSLELKADTENDVMLRMIRQSSTNSDPVLIKYEHDDDGSETQLGGLQMESDGTDVKTFSTFVVEDDGANSKTVLQSRYDYAANEARTNVLDNLKIDVQDASNTSNAIQVITSANLENSQDILVAELDYEGDALVDIPATMSQKMIFKVLGDNYNSGNAVEVGTLRAQADKADEMDHYVDLQVGSNSGNASTSLRVKLKQVEFTAPAKLYEIDAGSTLPASPSEGDWFFDTATAGSAALKRYNGSSWDTIDENGQMFYDSTNDRVCVNINGAWKPMSVGSTI